MPSIDDLIASERIIEAAELAEKDAQFDLAAELFERACAFPRAAQMALFAGRYDAALLFAVQGKATDIAEEALSRMLAGSPLLARIAPTLTARGDHGWAARVYEKNGDLSLAGQSWEKERAPVKAAAIYEKMGDVVRAARVLEAALRREADNEEIAISLGRLLARHSKHEAAVRTLQKIGKASPYRRGALTLLGSCFRLMGLERAAIEAEEELASLGGPASESEPDAPISQVKARIFGRYEVIREVASTPSARVLECTDCVRHEHVALKIFAGYHARGGGRDALVRFEREVKALGAIDHPNVVPLRDYIEEGPALVLEWMERGTLQSMLERETIAPARAIEIAIAVLGAIGEAHRLGILHRDIKPSNVLFDRAGVAHLGDFGVAHLGDISSTATAGVIGTMGYMSPEQRRGHPATIASDIFGVGAILWEMLTGARFDAAEGARNTRPSAVHRDLDARHDALLARFLSENPAERPEDAFSARKLVASLPWATSFEPAVKPVSVRPASIAEESERVARDAIGNEIDTRTGRRIERIALAPSTIARARAFARAAHPSLQTVLRIDRISNHLWLATPHGTLPHEPLREDTKSELAEALRALHEAGIVHGSVDREHIRVSSSEVTLLFTSEARANADARGDFSALARL